jgi:hypothetical protein
MYTCMNAYTCMHSCMHAYTYINSYVHIARQYEPIQRTRIYSLSHTHIWQCDDRQVADSATVCVSRLCRSNAQLHDALFSARIHILLLRHLLRHAHAIVSAGGSGAFVYCKGILHDLYAINVARTHWFTHVPLHEFASTVIGVRMC